MFTESIRILKFSYFFPPGALVARPGPHGGPLPRALLNHVDVEGLYVRPVHAVPEQQALVVVTRLVDGTDQPRVRERLLTATQRPSVRPVS